MKNFSRRSSSIFWCALVFVLTAFVVLAQPILAQDGSPAATSTMSLFFASLAVVAVVCLIVGWENPKRFKFVLGDKATTPFVRGGFGAAILVFGFLGQSLDPGRADEQIVANERRVAQSEARIQDAKDRERKAEESERAAKKSERKAQEEARDAQTRQRRAQKESERAQKKVELAKAQEVRDQKAREKRESEESNGAPSPGKPSANWTKKLNDVLGGSVKTQQVQSYVSSNGVILTLRNRDDFAWTDVKININPTFGYLGGYEHSVGKIRSGGEIIVPLREFADPKGNRLKPLEVKLLTFALRCKAPNGIGVSRGKWPPATD